MSGTSPTRALLEAQARRRRGDLAIAAISAAAAASAATLMLGLSGWFLAGAALAGLAGAAAAQAFNYLLPSAGLRALAIIRTVGRYGERLFAHRAAFHALAAVRPALFAGIAAAPPRQALALSGGEASSRLVQDVDAVETMFVRRPAPWAAAAAAVAATAGVAMASPWAAGAFLIGLGLQLVIVRSLAIRLTAAPDRARLRAAGTLKDALSAYAPATTELQSFELTGRAVEAVMAHDATLGDAVRRGRDAGALLDLIEALVAAATLVAVAMLSAGAPMPMAALAVLSAFAGMEGAAGVLRAARRTGAFQEAVSRLDAAVASPSAPTCDALPDANLRIDGVALPPGGRLAITGPSGCGKTSLLEALIGLRDAPAGRVAVGGAALEARPLGWARALFAYAPQDARLVTGTIADNLRLGTPDASDDALWSALSDAQLDSRVRALPRGLDTWIGDGGEILSGGERRRLSIARALLRPAPWLLLDEPTEGLDGATEAALVDALAARLRLTGQGLILVSHRAQPLALAQQRLELDQPATARQAT